MIKHKIRIEKMLINYKILYEYDTLLLLTECFKIGLIGKLDEYELSKYITFGPHKLSNREKITTLKAFGWWHGQDLNRPF